MTGSRIIDIRVREFAAESALNLDTLVEYTEQVVTGYITALLWSETCNGTMPECDHLGRTGEDAQQCDKPLDSEYGECDLTEGAYAEIRQDVAHFVCENWADLYGNEGEVDDSDPDAPPVIKRMDPQQAGHDFLLTRNGHGAGFWDRGLGERGDRLTEACRPYGTMSAYVTEDGWDGWVGVDG